MIRATATLGLIVLLTIGGCQSVKLDDLANAKQGTLPTANNAPASQSPADDEQNVLGAPIPRPVEPSSAWQAPRATPPIIAALPDHASNPAPERHPAISSGAYSPAPRVPASPSAGQACASSRCSAPASGHGAGTLGANVSNGPAGGPKYLLGSVAVDPVNVGVSGAQPRGSAPKQTRTTGSYEVVRVFYGTDRSAAVASDGEPTFSTDHAKLTTFGTVDVSIPAGHSTGHIESQPWWHFESQQDPSRDMTMLHVAVTSYEQFRAEMRSKALNAPTPSVLLFIHGYRVGFKDAALRTAQMAHDLDFAGAPVFFSWPSHGDLLGYFDDEQAIERAQADIEQFVVKVLAATPGANLYVIAHSMGNRGLTRALVSFAHDHPEDIGRIREVVLAAPDIDTDVFVNQIAPNLVAIGAPVTLYASSTDQALRISETIHGGPRAGDSGQNLVVLKGIETIDVTNVDTDLTGHSYVGNQRSILSDLYYIIHDNKRAGSRFGLSSSTKNGEQYWVFNK